MRLLREQEKEYGKSKIKIVEIHFKPIRIMYLVTVGSFSPVQSFVNKKK